MKFRFPNSVSRRLPAFALAVFCFCSAAGVAAVVPAALFTDHAVLPRERPVPVWGEATPGETVTVGFAGQSVSVVANAQGKWQAQLAAMPASGEARTLSITGRDTRLTFTDVVVGEVWLASGQSNMERLMRLTEDASLDVATSANFPLIRHFDVSHRVAATPQDDVSSTQGGWQRPGPDVTGNFTAIGYYFAKELYLRLGVPVGIVKSTWGGTPVEAWTSAHALAASASGSAVEDRWEKELAALPQARIAYEKKLAARAAAEQAGQPVDKRRPQAPRDASHQRYPANLFNGMINGLAPFPFQGVIWYQGEANASFPGEYSDLFTTLVKDWRRHFADTELDFFWVQLANFSAGDPVGTAWAELRAGQDATLALPHTGQAVIIDIGDVFNIHPHNKFDVARRLARLALHRTYGIDIVDTGPTVSSLTLAKGHVQLTFADSPASPIHPTRELTGFELAGPDGVFHPATATWNRQGIALSSDAVAAPTEVRYAWCNAPEASVFNTEGLPLAPFSRPIAP